MLPIELTTVIYFSNDSLLAINKNNHVKNAVFVFGDDKDNDDTYAFSINETAHDSSPISILNTLFQKIVVWKSVKADLYQTTETELGKEMVHLYFFRFLNLVFPQAKNRLNI